ncbi:MAG: CPBP family intramembrane metalloprotease, partial [Chitinophagales bacterium]|nr:CPBP family intramembrane metalloprotease [Chitinophagales bacterium]
FSGFLPRVILGMFLGYLFYYSGSLWTSIFAHAVNNGSQVVFMYLNNKGIYKMDVDNPVMPKALELIVYTAAFAGLCYIFYHFAQKRKNSTFV